MTKRRWSWVFLCAALALTIAAVWAARHQLVVLTRWKPAEGTLLRRDMMRNHDDDGFLYFQMQGFFRYMANGKEQTSTAVSPFQSPDFGWVAPQALAYKVGSQYPIRYDPEKPGVFEFGAGYNRAYFQSTLQFLKGASVCLLLGLLLHRFSRPPRRCIQCRHVIESFFRYCPECGESVAPV
jgi:hypothetical protein